METHFEQEEAGLTPEFLKHVCETDDLLEVARVELQVDSVMQNVETLGKMLPNLRHLKLTESSILSVRDLGICLAHLEVLWMSRCGLQDLSGMGSIPCLREFYLPFNHVTDLSPLSDHQHLEVLDIEGNAVSELEEVESLKMCAQLRELTVTGNPVCREPRFSREIVFGMLPQLEVLDDLGSDVVQGGPGYCSNCFANTANIGEGFLCPACAAGETGGTVSHGIDAVLLDATPAPASSTGSAPIEPLEPAHPKLAENLKRSTSQGTDPYEGEPDETELIVERVKLAAVRSGAGRGSLAMAAWGSRPGTGCPHSLGAFSNFHMLDRRHVRTVGSQPVVARAATTGGVNFDAFGERGADGASDLTCGEPLAGNPVMAARQRRFHKSGAVTERESGMDIRELLRRYQTYVQPSCLPEEELRARIQEAEQRRPITPDVRIRTTSSAASRAGSSLSKVSRPGTVSLRLQDDVGGTQLASSPSPLSGSSVIMSPTVRTTCGEALILDTPVDLE